MIQWIRNDQHLRARRDGRLIEVQGKTGSFSCQLATLFPHIHFQVEDSSTELINRGKENVPTELSHQVSFKQRDLFATRTRLDDESATPTVFLLRSALWSLDDTKVVTLLQSFIPALEGSGRPRILISDLVSPPWGTFEPHIERAYRRRDVTLMTMHNVKQRTATEWKTLISSADPRFEVSLFQNLLIHVLSPVGTGHIYGEVHIAQLSRLMGGKAGGHHLRDSFSVVNTSGDSSSKYHNYLSETSYSPRVP